MQVDDLRGAGAEASAEPAAPVPEEAEDARAEELARVKDQLLRALAEVENTRRRARKEVEDATRFAVSGFARDCLSVADNLERALASVPEDALKADERLAALHEGVAITRKELAADRLELRLTGRISPAAKAEAAALGWTALEGIK